MEREDAASREIEFPVRVTYDDPEEDDEVFDNEDSLCWSLEFFDSSDPEEGATVFDARGRRLLLILELQQIKVAKPLEESEEPSTNKKGDS